MKEQKELKIGVVGVGGRGTGVIRDTLLSIERIRITAVCDVYKDRMKDAADMIEKKYDRPLEIGDYKKLIDSPEVDAVIVMAAWEAHIDPAIYAMRAGKPVGVEVGGSYSIESCWDLVRTYEETKTPIMLLENCCYGRREMMALNMAKKGVFGKIVFCKGGYHHDLRAEVTYGNEHRHYRLRNYIHRNCENYPTHELGPIANVLGINRGNRMISLMSVSSMSEGIHEYIKGLDKNSERLSEKTELLQTNFAQGDIVVTTIKCANGEMIQLTLDTTLPRYYSRDFTVRGTKGMYEEVNDSVYTGTTRESRIEFAWKKQWGNADAYAKKYEHPIWKKYLKSGLMKGHDGMDWLVYNAFVNSAADKKPMPIDVYDMASWMVISALSEASIANGSTWMEIPDFTNGKWMNR